jgi:hypothetical protein
VARFLLQRCGIIPVEFLVGILEEEMALTHTSPSFSVNSPVAIPSTILTRLSSGTYEQQQDQDGPAVPSWSSKAVCMTYTIAELQWITPDDGQRNCLKHVEFHFQNKFEKLVNLFSFIIRRQLRVFFFVLRNSLNSKLHNLYTVTRVSYMFPLRRVIM